MKISVIIPARMQSSRFPGKPLAKILGLPMLEHVRRRCLLAKGIDQVVVATCDEEIRSAVVSFGGRVIMTSAEHFGCTDRIAEAAQKLDAGVIINVQGDEPTVLPGMIETFVTLFRGKKEVSCANLMIRIKNRSELADPNVIKVVLDSQGYALYFSRALIPFRRFSQPDITYYKQTGLYAYTKKFLALFCRLKPTPLEKTEGIDMLRALENGHKIKMKEISGLLYGVDTPEGLRRAERILRIDPLARKYSQHRQKC